MFLRKYESVVIYYERTTLLDTYGAEFWMGLKSKEELF